MGFKFICVTLDTWSSRTTIFIEMANPDTTINIDHYSLSISEMVVCNLAIFDLVELIEFNDLP